MKTKVTVAPSRLTPHASLSGLNKSTLTRLAKLGIAAQCDLVLHLPLRYDDETRLYPISEAPRGQTVLIEGSVVECDIKYRPRRQLVCHIEDGSSVLTLRFFNFYTSQQKQLAAGARIRAFGEIRQGFFGAEMVHPKYRVVRGELPVSQALTPVYPTTAGLGQEALRRLIERALADCDLSDTLPDDVIKALRLARFREAVLFLHNPPPNVAQHALQERRHPAWRRIKFDELLAQQLSMRLHYKRRRAAGAPALTSRNQLTRALQKKLPFQLTSAQQKALAQIWHDLTQPYPMQRLLQGDVGSGKTIVAALAALQCVENGFQVAVMAPTEILTEQHYHKFSGWLADLGVNVAWLAGSLRQKQKREALERVAAGEVMVAIGTHALFQEEVRFHNLALAIIDEQHRFGVHQRLALRMKGTRPAMGAQPHQLMMSATPIPRTLAMSYYADLDVSVIDEMPPGRTPVATRLIAESRRPEVIQRVRDACMAGSQAYWVCPLIEESDAGTRSRAGEAWSRGPVYGDATVQPAIGASGAGLLRAAGGQIPEGPSSAPRRAPLGGCDREGGEAARSGSPISRTSVRGRSETLQLKTALETHAALLQTFPELRVGLVHGRLKGDEKAAVMQAFQRGEIQLLVATTVIEVGVDVPNASLMVIEHAERMGLSQLHQLRGRVGRGAEKSTCILLYQNPLTETARERLKIIYENRDGFEIARHDLRLRGPGELLGARQSGVPLLRFADLAIDIDLLDAARAAAEMLLRGHPDAVRAHLARWLGAKYEYLKV